MIIDGIGVIPPKSDDIDVFYACSKNKERNVIGTKHSQNCLMKHMIVKPCDND